MGQVRSLDQKLNDSNFLRLCTEHTLINHIGNRVSGAVHIEETRSSSSRRRIADLPLIRRSLMWIYDRIFRLYFERN